MTEKEFLKIQKKTWIFYKYQVEGPVVHTYMLISDVSKEGRGYIITKYMTIREIKTGTSTKGTLIFYKTSTPEVIDDFWSKKMHVQKYLSDDTLASIFSAIFAKRFEVI